MGHRDIRTARLLPALVVAGLGLAAVLWPSLGIGRAAPEGEARIATSGNNSELIKKLPITRETGAKPRVVMSIVPGRLRALRRHDRLKVSAEVQVTDNCDDPGKRCVGPLYRYNPIGRAQLVLSDGKDPTRGLPLTDQKRFICRQQLPDREHHCVIVFSRGGLDVGDPDNLPCPADRCFVNLVMDAHNPRASRGDVLLIGGNRPDGSVPQDRGRVNAIVLRPGNAAYPEPRVTKQRRLRSLRLDKKRRVIYSQRLAGLHAGDGLEVTATAVTDRSALPYSTITATQVILAERPNQARPAKLAKKVIAGGEITESNGYNCTRRKSACVSRKAGVAKVRADAGRPLYVNVVTLAGPKRSSAMSGDRQRVLRRGELAVTRYRAPNR